MRNRSLDCLGILLSLRPILFLFQCNKAVVILYLGINFIHDSTRYKRAKFKYKGGTTLNCTFGEVYEKDRRECSSLVRFRLYVATRMKGRYGLIVLCDRLLKVLARTSVYNEFIYDMVIIEL